MSRATARQRSMLIPLHWPSASLMAKGGATLVPMMSVRAGGAVSCATARRTGASVRASATSAAVRKTHIIRLWGRGGEDGLPLLSAAPDESLLRAQRDHRVDPRGASCGEIARERGDRGEED